MPPQAFIGQSSSAPKADTGVPPELPATYMYCEAPVHKYCLSAIELDVVAEHPGIIIGITGFPIAKNNDNEPVDSRAAGSMGNDSDKVEVEGTRRDFGARNRS